MVGDTGCICASGQGEEQPAEHCQGNIYSKAQKQEYEYVETRGAYPLLEVWRSRLDVGGAYFIIFHLL